MTSMNNITPGVTSGTYSHMVTPSKGAAQQSQKSVSATNAKITQSNVSQKATIKDQIDDQISFWAEYGVKCDSQGRPIRIKVIPQLTPQLSAQPSPQLSPEPAEQTIVDEESEPDDNVPYVEPEDFEIPSLNCPITMDAIHDPIATRCGHIFERSALQAAYNLKNTDVFLCSSCRIPVEMDDTIEIYTLENAGQEVINVAEKCEQANQKSREAILRTKAKLDWNKMTLKEKVEFDKIERADAAKDRADFAAKADKDRADFAKKLADITAKFDKDRADFRAWMGNLVRDTIKELDQVQNHLDVAIKATNQIEKKEIKSTIPAHKSKMNQALQTRKKIAPRLVNLLSKITYCWIIPLFLSSTQSIISLIKIPACKIQELFRRLFRICQF